MIQLNLLCRRKIEGICASERCDPLQVLKNSCWQWLVETEVVTVFLKCSWMTNLFLGSSWLRSRLTWYILLMNIILQSPQQMPRLLKDYSRGLEILWWHQIDAFFPASQSVWSCIKHTAHWRNHGEYSYNASPLAPRTDSSIGYCPSSNHRTHTQTQRVRAHMHVFRHLCDDNGSTSDKVDRGGLSVLCVLWMWTLLSLRSELL